MVVGHSDDGKKTYTGIKDSQLKFDFNLMNPKVFTTEAPSQIWAYHCGGDIQPKRDSARFVHWPKYVRVKHTKMIMLTRLKLPPAINQFNLTIDMDQNSWLLRLLKKCQSETREAKKAPLMEHARASGSQTWLESRHDPREQKAAKLVAIARDVCCLPAPCKWSCSVSGWLQLVARVVNEANSGSRAANVANALLWALVDLFCLCIVSFRLLPP
jgi:hypothetical protein